MSEVEPTTPLHTFTSKDGRTHCTCGLGDLKAEIERAAVEPWRERVVALMDVGHGAITERGHDCVCYTHEAARALLEGTDDAT